MNTAEAVRLAKAGNEAGYQYLYETTYKSKYYLALQYMKNEEDAQDVIQESYMKAFSRLDTLSQPEAFSSWLGRIVANTAKNALVKKNPLLFSDIGTEEQGEVFEEQIEDENIENQPELSYTRQETRELVHQLIDSLSDEQRVCILMFYMEGDSIKNIASVLGCSENTVKSRLNYGRKNLKIKAEELQKKGYKLFGIVPVVLLCQLLQKEETVLAAEGAFASASAVSEAQIVPFVRNRIAGGAGQGMAGGAGAGNAGAAGAGAAAGVLSMTVVKVLIGVIAAALVGIGALSVKLHLDSRKEETLQETVPQETLLPETTAAETTEAPETSAEEVTDLDRALEQYRVIVSQADTYEYGSSAGTPTGNYRYALVMMAPDDPVPTLLLSQEDDMYFYHIRVFQYDPETDSVFQPQEVLEEGSGGGYYRASVAMEGDGNGIQVREISGGTGETELTRVTMDGDTLHQEQQWTGRMDQIPAEMGTIEIEWHDIQDGTALDGWETETAPSPSQTETAETPQQTAAETAPPTDGDRIVFSGTIDTYSYDEVVALQGEPDPNAQWADTSGTYQLIVLDAPQTMELRTIDGYRSGEVRLINVTYAGDLSPYNGQHLTFSIDAAATYWPSDTSLPIGQPSTTDIHILE